MVFFCAEHVCVVRFSLRPTGTGQLSGSKENSAEYANGSLEQIYCISVSWITAERPYNVLRFSQHVLSHQRHVSRFSQHVLLESFNRPGTSNINTRGGDPPRFRAAKRRENPGREAPRLPEGQSPSVTRAAKRRENPGPR